MSWHEQKSYDYRTSRRVAILHSIASRRGWRNRQFWSRAQRELGQRYDVRSPDFMKRRMWFTAMVERGREGRIDNRTRAKIVYPLTEKNYLRWIKDENFRRKFDIEDVDVPLKDVEEIKVHGTPIYIGGRTKACRVDTKKLVKKVLENNFTPSEVHTIKNLYIERVPYRIEQDARHSADTMRGGQRANIIELNKAKEETLTHELTHAFRWMKGVDARRGATATPTEEKKAELETVARVSDKAFKSRSDRGYYSFLPNPLQARETDRRAVSGSLKRKSVGSSVSERAEKYYPKSQIKKVKL